MEVQCPPHISTGDAPLWDCWTTWKPNWNAKSPSNSKPPSNKPWMTYQPLCDQRRLAMHRHHRYARAIATSYGEVRVQIPVFCCGQRRRMAGGMTLLGAEMRYQRFSKKTVTLPSAWLRA